MNIKSITKWRIKSAEHVRGWGCYTVARARFCMEKILPLLQYPILPFAQQMLIIHKFAIMKWRNVSQKNSCRHFFGLPTKTQVLKHPEDRATNKWYLLFFFDFNIQGTHRVPENRDRNGRSQAIQERLKEATPHWISYHFCKIDHISVYTRKYEFNPRNSCKFASKWPVMVIKHYEESKWL